jgi:DNA-binding transcriptional ArsR family regulator
MSKPPFEQLADLDRLIHEPARLSILTALSACRSADFLFLQRLTGLSKGNLSAHLSKLETGELVEIAKTYAGKIPRTTVRLTRGGRTQLERHWNDLDRLRVAARHWQSDEEEEKEKEKS